MITTEQESSQNFKNKIVRPDSFGATKIVHRNTAELEELDISKTIYIPMSIYMKQYTEKSIKQKAYLKYTEYQIAFTLLKSTLSTLENVQSRLPSQRKKEEEGF